MKFFGSLDLKTSIRLVSLPLIIGMIFGHFLHPLTALAAGGSGSSKSLFQLAAGTSLGFLKRRDFGEGNSERFYLEPVVHGYISLGASSFFIRPSLMFSYVWDQPEMPQALRIEETEVYLGAGIGVLFDWIVVPSLTFGAQLVSRDIKLKVSDPIEIEEESMSQTESLTALFFQGGFGVPLFSGLIVLEPFYRQRVFLKDEREGGAYGVEITAQIL